MKLAIRNTFVVSIVIDENFRVEGEGATYEEAMENCLKAARALTRTRIKIAEGVQVPEDVASRIPEEIPDGHSLVIFVRHSHNDGEAYDWRLVSVPTGSKISGRDIEGGKTVIRKQIEMITFLDSNSGYSFKLSQGGLEFGVEGKTESIQEVAYDY